MQDPVSHSRAETSLLHTNCLHTLIVPTSCFCRWFTGKQSTLYFFGGVKNDDGNSCTVIYIHCIPWSCLHSESIFFRCSVADESDRLLSIFCASCLYIGIAATITFVLISPLLKTVPNQITLSSCLSMFVKN